MSLRPGGGQRLTLLVSSPLPIRHVVRLWVRMLEHGVSVSKAQDVTRLVKDLDSTANHARSASGSELASLNSFHREYQIRSAAPPFATPVLVLVAYGVLSVAPTSGSLTALSLPLHPLFVMRKLVSTMKRVTSSILVTSRPRNCGQK